MMSPDDMKLLKLIHDEGGSRIFDLNYDALADIYAAGNLIRAGHLSFVRIISGSSKVSITEAGKAALEAQHV